MRVCDYCKKAPKKQAGWATEGRWKLKSKLSKLLAICYWLILVFSYFSPLQGSWKRLGWLSGAPTDAGYDRGRWLLFGGSGFFRANRDSDGQQRNLTHLHITPPKESFSFQRRTLAGRCGKPWPMRPETVRRGEEQEKKIPANDYKKLE